MPLGEAAELYRLEILDRRRRAAHRHWPRRPAYLYSAAIQTADFGSTQWNVAIRVTQMSPVYGAGIAAKLTYDYQH